MESKINVLVVDDDSIILDLVVEQLAEQGIHADTALSVEAALRSVRSFAPDLVLSDIQMSPRDGYALLRALHKTAPEIPVVLMSAFPPPGTHQNVERAGAKAFLRKPFTGSELLEVLMSAVPS